MKKWVFYVLATLLVLGSVLAFAAEDVYDPPKIKDYSNQFAVGNNLEITADYGDIEYYNISGWEWKLNGISQGLIDVNYEEEEDMDNWGEWVYYAKFSIPVSSSGSFALRYQTVDDDWSCWSEECSFTYVNYGPLEEPVPTIQ